MITKHNPFPAKHKPTFSPKPSYTKKREISYINRTNSILKILKFGRVPNIFRLLHMLKFFSGLNPKFEAPLQSVCLGSINPALKKRVRPTRFCSRRVRKQMEQFELRREWLLPVSSSVRSREHQMNAGGVRLREPKMLPPTIK